MPSLGREPLDPGAEQEPQPLTHRARAPLSTLARLNMASCGSDDGWEGVAAAIQEGPPAIWRADASSHLVNLGPELSNWQKHPRQISNFMRVLRAI